MAVDLEGRGLEVLCDRHVIPMLMFLGRNGPSRKTDIYRAVGRSPNLPIKIDRMRGAGLVTVDVIGISEVVGLTDLGNVVVGGLEQIETALAGQ